MNINSNTLYKNSFTKWLKDLNLFENLDIASDIRTVRINFLPLNVKSEGRRPALVRRAQSHEIFS